MRVGVLDLLISRAEPLAATRILEAMPAGTDAVTVYRTLNTFVRKKLVHRVRGEDRTWRYAAGAAKEASVHQHPHFVCEQCGRVECLEGAQVPAPLVPSLKIGKAYAIRYAEVVLHGTCPRCRTTPSGSDPPRA